LPEYTVVFPLYFYVRDENTTRLHVWPVFGVQTFDDARVVEYSTLYPFFRYTTFAPTDDAATQHEQVCRLCLQRGCTTYLTVTADRTRSSVLTLCGH
jgi:hypothetical protein